MKDKENVVIDFKTMIMGSWSYAKMDEREQKRLLEVLESQRVLKTLKGTYTQRFETLNSIYYAYLMALDYTWNWRETKKESKKAPLF